MERTVPLWLFLLYTLVWILFTVAFGWIVASTLSGGEKSSAIGEAAVEIASFPETTKSVIGELLQYTSGEYKDEHISVKRENNADYSNFEPAATDAAIDVPGLFITADPARMQDGWRVLAGAFQINGDVENAVLLLSPDLKVVKSWILDEVAIGDLEPRLKGRKLVHGMDILPDGSVIFTFDGAVSLQKFNACGDRVWANPGDYHHAVTLDEAGKTVWTFNSFTSIAQVNVDDGEVIRQMSMDEIIAANPTIDILGARHEHANDLGTNGRNTEGIWMNDPFHLNDVDPLPAALADRFDGFEAGDLLVSSRSLSLIFVLDPETLEVKWWRAGAVQRQHDPDWLESGEIMVLNNRMSRDFSEVVTFDPNTLEKTVILDGRDHGFYTRVRGKQQILPDGTLAVTSPQQGRAFEVDQNGETVFDVVNLKPESTDTNYVISEMKWLPRDYFDKEIWECGKVS